MSFLAPVLSAAVNRAHSQVPTLPIHDDTKSNIASNKIDPGILQRSLATSGAEAPSLASRALRIVDVNQERVNGESGIIKSHSMKNRLDTENKFEFSIKTNKV